MVFEKQLLPSLTSLPSIGQAFSVNSDVSSGTPMLIPGDRIFIELGLSAYEPGKHSGLIQAGIRSIVSHFDRFAPEPKRAWGKLSSIITTREQICPGAMSTDAAVTATRNVPLREFPSPAGLSASVIVDPLPADTLVQSLNLDESMRWVQHAWHGFAGRQQVRADGSVHSSVMKYERVVYYDSNTRHVAIEIV